MAGEIALFHFPGVEAVEAGSYTHAHGTSPGVFSITCRPQAQPPQHRGNVTIYQGSTVLTFPDCIIDQAEFTIDGSGQVIGLTILDRRWKWQFPTISGQYNVYKANGELDHATEKTPQELARLLLEAMGEPAQRIGALPNDARPSVDWNYANAAQELERLCELLGCRVLLGPGSIVELHKLGVGAQLPNTPEIAAGGAVLDPPEAPDEFTFIGSPDRFQCDFELEAVGREADGEHLPIDELSYKPAAGWEAADLRGDADEVAEAGRALAKASVYKAYRIKIPAGGLYVPGYEKPITDRRQLEFLGQLLTTHTVDGETVPQDPFVYGVWFDGRDNLENNTTETLRPVSNNLTTDFDKVALYPYGFGFDERQQILHFGTLVTKQAETADGVTDGAAELRFRACFHIRDAETRAYVQTEARKATGYANGTKSQVIVQREYSRNVYPTYGASFNAFTLIDNQDEFMADAGYYVNLAIAALQTNNPQRLTYERIMPIHLDGAIQQVTWNVSNSSPPTTTASRNNDLSDYLPDYRERRRLQKQKQVTEAFQRLATITGGGAAGAAAIAAGGGVRRIQA